jgi:hypothetical protein
MTRAVLQSPASANDSRIRDNHNHDQKGEETWLSAIGMRSVVMLVSPTGYRDAYCCALMGGLNVKPAPNQLYSFLPARNSDTSFDRAPASSPSRSTITATNGIATCAIPTATSSKSASTRNPPSTPSKNSPADSNKLHRGGQPPATISRFTRPGPGARPFRFLPRAEPEAPG